MELAFCIQAGMETVLGTEVSETLRGQTPVGPLRKDREAAWLDMTEFWLTPVGPLRKDHEAAWLVVVEFRPTPVGPLRKDREAAWLVVVEF